jgi:hypothetical protein
VEFKSEHSEGIDLDALAEELEEFPDKMIAIVEREVQRERDTHRYQDRTGDAHASTQTALITKHADHVEVTAMMTVPYAGYLQGKWSRFNELMKKAADKVAAVQDKLRK